MKPTGLLELGGFVVWLGKMVFLDGLKSVFNAHNPLVSFLDALLVAWWTRQLLLLQDCFGPVLPVWETLQKDLRLLPTQ